MAVFHATKPPTVTVSADRATAHATFTHVRWSKLLAEARDIRRKEISAPGVRNDPRSGDT